MRPIIKNMSAAPDNEMESPSEEVNSLLETYTNLLSNITLRLSRLMFQCENPLSPLFKEACAFIFNEIAATYARTTLCALKLKADSAPCNLKKQTYKINENAVRLDDIEEWWRSDNEIVVIPSSTVRKEYDDVDLDFFQIHREAQKFNDCHQTNNTYNKQDLFYLLALLKHILSYLKEHWFDLSHEQRLIISKFINQKNSITILDYVLWFGYDSIIRSPKPAEEFQAPESYRFAEDCSKKYLQDTNSTMNDLAVKFGVEFSLSDSVISACDEHFKNCSRSRMPYTKNFKYA